MAFRAPLLGYNTNVRHKGKLYHIQTEDSGIDHPHVITHLFADGGRIIATKKTSYAERVGSEGLADIVKKLMQAQHKAIFIALRDGVYDEDQPPEEPRDRTAPQVIPPPVIAAPGPTTRESLAPPKSDAGSTAAEAASTSHPSEPVTSVSSTLSSPRTSRDSLQPPAPPPRPRRESLPGSPVIAAPGRAAFPAPAASSIERAASRRAVTQAALPRVPSPVPPKPAKEQPSRSLFGGELLSDKSLDEVILNYLAAHEKDS